MITCRYFSPCFLTMLFINSPSLRFELESQQCPQYIINYHLQSSKRILYAIPSQFIFFLQIFIFHKYYLSMTKICNSDVVSLFISKILRMFSFGAISVVFFDALIQKGIQEKQIGFLQSFVAVGDIIISLFLTTRADKLGRKNTLAASAVLKIFAGISYALSDDYILLIISGALGVLTISGGQIGPFLPIEQAAIAQIIEDNSPDQSRIKQDVAMMYGYYNMGSYISQAAGNLFTGLYLKYIPILYGGVSSDYYNHIIYMYSLFGLLKLICYLLMSDRIEPNPDKAKAKAIVNCAGLTKESTGTIAMLSALFFVDSFAGGFVAQSFLSYYYEAKYNFQMDSVGGILFVCNIVGGISGVYSSKLVAKIGAMATMIFTHLPSNVLLMFVALTSNANLAVFYIMARFCISQMDVPARQTYVSMVVSAEERSAANGITNIARSVGVALAFPVAGFLWQTDKQSFLFSLPFLISGVLKIIYDLTLGGCFLWSKKSQEEQKKKQFKTLNQTQSLQSENQMKQIKK